MGGATHVSEAERTEGLVKRVLDTPLLSSCSSLFDAFDEKALFQREEGAVESITGQKAEFKSVFQRVSKILDCVACKKCKLHSKLSMLGIGTALKVLLLPDDLVAGSLNRSEVVALFNTLAKFSHAIHTIEHLAALHWAESSALGSGAAAVSPGAPPSDERSLVDQALGAVAGLARRGGGDGGGAGLLSADAEDALVDAILSRNADVLLLAKHFAAEQPARFTGHALRAVLRADGAGGPSGAGLDAVVVGGGLAGLSATLTLLDRGAHVILVDKEAVLGGNSAWASSGINAVDSASPGDSVEGYMEDTLRSSGLEDSELIRVLAVQSGPTLRWLRERVGLPLEKVGQLGGHSHPRTFRPADGLAGQQLVTALLKQLKKFQESGALEIRKKTAAVQILQSGDGQVVGISVKDLKTGEIAELSTSSVVLATGGFAANDHQESLIDQYRPDLSKFPTTNGHWANGDGHKLAILSGADTVEMDHVQVHPTGFVDPADRSAHTKTLCAEILRGVGAILLDRQGLRFANELGRRDYLSDAMLAADPEGKTFTILLNEKAAAEANKHVPLYLKKGLLVEHNSLHSVADWMNVDVAVLEATLDSYESDAAKGSDAHGKVAFNNLPFRGERYYTGSVTPVVHYTMGGVHVDAKGRVMSGGTVVKGLYAAGEVTGGIHGKNRLGGNALTECAVFGRIVGAQIPVLGKEQAFGAGSPDNGSKRVDLPTITERELAEHNSAADSWVALHGKVYDMTEFASDHPAGSEPVTKLSGSDGTETFSKVHTESMLDEFTPLGFLGSV